MLRDWLYWFLYSLTRNSSEETFGMTVRVSSLDVLGQTFLMNLNKLRKKKKSQLLLSQKKSFHISQLLLILNKREKSGFVSIYAEILWRVIRRKLGPVDFKPVRTGFDARVTLQKNPRDTMGKCCHDFLKFLVFIATFAAFVSWYLGTFMAVKWLVTL